MIALDHDPLRGGELLAIVPHQRRRRIDQENTHQGAGRYTLFRNGGHDVGGLMATPPDASEGQAHWLGHIAVGDLDAALTPVPELGGKVLMPAKDIPEVGRICVIADPVGAVVPLMQPAEPHW